MFGLNNAQLIGRLGADATISHLTNGGRVANVSIATDESYLDKNSEILLVPGGRVQFLDKPNGNGAPAKNGDSAPSAQTAATVDDSEIPF